MSGAWTGCRDASGTWGCRATRGSPACPGRRGGTGTSAPPAWTASQGPASQANQVCRVHSARQGMTAIAGKVATLEPEVRPIPASPVARLDQKESMEATDFPDCLETKATTARLAWLASLVFLASRGCAESLDRVSASVRLEKRAIPALKAHLDSLEETASKEKKGCLGCQAYLEQRANMANQGSRCQAWSAFPV